MSSKAIERHRTHNREISESMTITQRGLVFFEDHIFDPMETLFNVPVLANALGKACGIQCARTDVEHRFGIRLVASGANPCNAHEALDTNPAWVKVSHCVEYTDRALGLAVTRLFGLYSDVEGWGLLKLSLQLGK